MKLSQRIFSFGIFGKRLSGLAGAEGIALLDKIVNLDVLIIRPIRANTREKNEQQNNNGKEPFHDDV